MAFIYNQELIDSGLSYIAYQQGINDILSKPSVNEASEKMRSYTQNNIALMYLYDQTYKLSDKLKTRLEMAPPTMWLVITEGWCGDAAFNVPMLAAIERALPNKVKLRIFLRDSNLELMDAHLSDGGRSIPKLVIISKAYKKLGTWGPRPEGLQILMKIWKREGLALKELIPKVHEWYNTDATRSIQNELETIIKSYC
jgi:hypothetical protein